MATDSRHPIEIPGLEDFVLVGRGGFAVVYRAYQPAFRRAVAVKVVSVTHVDDLTRERFHRECQAMGLLSEHPGIVTVLDAGFLNDERPYLVMAYMTHGSLADRIRSDGPMGWQDASRVGVKLAGALDTAHQAGVIHRDVKPANVLVSQYGEPQLSDFGIARVAGGAETTSGVVTASLAFAPPEIVEGGRPTVRSDVYSLGATLYALISGAAPFHRSDDSIGALLRRILSAPPDDLRPDGLPGPAWEVVARALAKDPDQRHESTAEFGRELREAQDRMGLRPTELTLLEVPEAEPRTADTVEERERPTGREPMESGEPTELAAPANPLGVDTTKSGPSGVEAVPESVDHERTAPSPPARQVEPPPRGASARRRWAGALGLAALLLTVIALTVSALNSTPEPSSTTDAALPTSEVVDPTEAPTTQATSATTVATGDASTSTITPDTTSGTTGEPRVPPALQGDPIRNPDGSINPDLLGLGEDDRAALRSSLCTSAGPDFIGQSLEDEDFAGQDLTCADFTGALLRGADFSNAELAGATFAMADVRSADFTRAHIEGAVFTQVDGRSALFPYTNGRLVDFSAAILDDANFSRSLLFGLFWNASFRGADFFGAGLEMHTQDGMDLTDARLLLATFFDVSGIVFGNTMCPDGSNSDQTRGTCDLHLDREATISQVCPDGVVAVAPGAIPDVVTEADLSCTDFRGLDLRGTRFHSVNLIGSDFTGSDLSGSEFSESDLVLANFDKAILRDARFEGMQLLAIRNFATADITGARFLGLNFNDCDLTGVDFTVAGEWSSVSLSSSVLAGATLTGLELQAEVGDFTGATMVGVVMRPHMSDGDFTDADLTGASATGVNFNNATFVGANLTDVRFVGSIFVNADLRDADLTRADFTGADLTGAVLTGARLSQADLAGVMWLNTTCPDGSISVRVDPCNV